MKRSLRFRLFGKRQTAAMTLLAALCSFTLAAIVPATAVVGSTTAPKQSPPEAAPPRPLKMPKPVIYKLDNGLTVVLLEDHRVPFITFQYGVDAGNTTDLPGMTGIASIVGDMMAEGTETMTSKQIADQVDFIGGTIKAVTDADFTILSGSALSQYKDQLLGILSDMLLHPTFPESELKLQKANLLQELGMMRSHSSFLNDERFHKVIFGDHPYSTVAPTPESVERITRNDLEKYHHTYYVPNTSTLVIVGDFKVADMQQLIKKDFGAWKSGTVAEAKLPNCPKLSGGTVYLVNRPGSVQSSLKIGNLGIKKTDPDYFAAVVGNQILGGAANSRLFLNIREQKGYTYGAYSSFTPRRYPGEFTAGADVRTPVTGPALHEFLFELDRICKSPVTDTELKSAKNSLVGNFQTGFETQSGVAQRLLEQQIYKLPADYLDTYTDKIMAVTADDIRAAAAKHIDLNDYAICVVGDADKIEPDLRKVGPVEVYDQNGKLVRKDAKLDK